MTETNNQDPILTAHQIKSDQLEEVARRGCSGILTEMRNVCEGNAALVVGSHTAVIDLLTQTLGGLTTELVMKDAPMQAFFEEMVTQALTRITEIANHEKSKILLRASTKKPNIIH